MTADMEPPVSVYIGGVDVVRASDECFPADYRRSALWSEPTSTRVGSTILLPQAAAPEEGGRAIADVDSAAM